MVYRIAIAVLLLSGSVLAQARVGTNFEMVLFGFPASVRSAGMGTVGVMLTDSDAAPNNPALPVLGGYEHFSASFYPASSKAYGMDDVRYRAESVAAKLPLSHASPLTLAIGYSREGLTFGPIIERAYNLGLGNSDDESVYFGEYIRTATVSAAWTGPVQVAVGVGMKWIRSDIPNVSLSGQVWDLGIAARVPLNPGGVAPTDPLLPRVGANLLFGLSFQNYGPDIETEYGWFRPPKTGRWGFGFEMTYGDGFHHWLTIIPVFEKKIRFTSERDPEYRLGLEVGMAEFIYLRFGRVDLATDDSNIADDHNTLGVGVSTVGLRKLISGDTSTEPSRSGFGRYLLDNLNLEFSFARIDRFPEIFDGTDYYALRLTL